MVCSAITTAYEVRFVVVAYPACLLHFSAIQRHAFFWQIVVVGHRGRSWNRSMEKQ